MRAILLSALLLPLLQASPAAAASLNEGAYELTGYNPGDTTTKTYKGYVMIAKAGDGYSLEWRIGRRQTQKGVALLTGDVLSVAYIDMSGRDSGVVSYRVRGPGKLDGLWLPHGTKVAGREVLVWKAKEEPLEVGDRQ